MTRLRYITVALAALCVLAVAAPPAFARDNNWKNVIRECYNTGDLTKDRYTRNALKTARRRIPSDIREYSDCLDLINAALAAFHRNERGGVGGGPGGGAPALPGGSTPSGAVGDPRDLEALQRETDPKTRPRVPPDVAIAGQSMSPATSGLINAATRTDANTLPLPLILSLAALAAMAVLGAAAVLRQRWPQTRRAALRLLRR